MTHAPSQTGSDARPAAGTVSGFERVLFFVLLAVFSARPLIPESFERLELSFLSVLGVGGGTTPATTAWLDSLTLTAAVAVLARRTGRGRGWVLWGIALLAVAVGVSVLAAGDQRLALNAGFSLLVAVLGSVALVQLMRADWMPRLLLAATLATGCAAATKCVTWEAYEYDDTVKQWQESREKLAAAGTDFDSPLLINFERRLQSAEASAYQSHPNIAGSYLMMALLAAAGVLAGWLVGRGGVAASDRAAAIVLSAAMCVLLGIGLWLTHSTGALASLVVGLALFLACGCLRRKIARHAGRAVVVLAAGYLATIAGATAYGVSRGTLPHPSLQFRWYYWTAAAKAFEEAPLTGIGRANFADAYLRYKPIESTEEVRDPHNLWVSLLVELGPLGLAGGALLIGGCVWGALRRLDTAEAGIEARRAVTAGQLTAAAIGTLLIHAVFWGELANAATLLLWALSPAGVWVLVLVLAARLLDQLPRSAAGQGWLIAGLAAALLAALAHGLLDFALLTPGGQCVFAALAACAFALRAGTPREPAHSARLIPALLGMVLVGGHLALVTVPTMRAEFWLRQMRGAQFDHNDAAACRTVLSWGRTALAADPLDAAAAREVAGLALAMGSNPRLPSATQLELLEQAKELARIALKRNPRSYAVHAGLARICRAQEEAYLSAARVDESIRALEQATEHWQRAIELHPTDPRLRIPAGQTWFDWWQETGDPAAARTAARHFATALEIDATRKPEEVVRLRPAELAIIHLHLRELEQAGFGVPTASAPAP